MALNKDTIGSVLSSVSFFKGMKNNTDKIQQVSQLVSKNAGQIRNVFDKVESTMSTKSSTNIASSLESGLNDVTRVIEEKDRNTQGSFSNIKQKMSFMRDTLDNVNEEVWAIKSSAYRNRTSIKTMQSNFDSIQANFQRQQFANIEQKREDDFRYTTLNQQVMQNKLEVGQARSALADLAATLQSAGSNNPSGSIIGSYLAYQIAKFALRNPWVLAAGAGILAVGAIASFIAPKGDPGEKVKSDVDKLKKDLGTGADGGMSPRRDPRRGETKSSVATQQRTNIGRTKKLTDGFGPGGAGGNVHGQIERLYEGGKPNNSSGQQYKPASNRDKAILDHAKRWGISPEALAGALDIESGVNTSARGGFKNKFYGAWQLEDNQIPELARRAGLGSLTPQEYQQLSLDDQLKVHGEYMKKWGIEPSFFTGEAAQDSAKLWALQLSPANAKKINYDEPNSVISRTNQASAISATRGLVTVGSVQNSTVNRGKKQLSESSTKHESDTSVATKINKQYGPKRPGDVDESIQNIAQRSATSAGMEEITFTSGKGNWISESGKKKGQKTTVHSTGRAVDVTGFENDSQRRSFIREAYKNGAKGIGVYKDGSIHIDMAGDREWSWGGAISKKDIRSLKTEAKKDLANAKEDVTKQATNTVKEEVEKQTARVVQQSVGEALKTAGHPMKPVGKKEQQAYKVSDKLYDAAKNVPFATGQINSGFKEGAEKNGGKYDPETRTLTNLNPKQIEEMNSEVIEKIKGLGRIVPKDIQQERTFIRPVITGSSNQQGEAKNSHDPPINNDITYSGINIPGENRKKQKQYAKVAQEGNDSPAKISPNEESYQEVAYYYNEQGLPVI